MKICSKCKQLKHESEFTKSASRLDGLHGHCKSCRKLSRLEPEDRKFTIDQGVKAHRERVRKAIGDYLGTLIELQGCVGCGCSYRSCVKFYRPRLSRTGTLHLMRPTSLGVAKVLAETHHPVCANCKIRIEAGEDVTHLFKEKVRW